jgi:hypothetical protein
MAIWWSVFPRRSTFQKKLFAERNIKFPPRSRYRVTALYSRPVTYSWWPGKMISS